ncbi:MAG: Ferredoxin [Methanobacterium sp. PtaB.Bin024]|jgi:ferredoxin|nr:MAG: Ferredoxin [Methanobacterium sp. PtaB.Bin024]
MIIAKLNEKNCEGPECGKCAYVCPINMFTIRNDSVILTNPDYCKFCKKCLEVCPNAAITIQRVQGIICNY